MATYVKYNCFAASDLPGKIHDLLGTAGSSADNLCLALSNATPSVSAHTILADVTEISTANGYTATSPTLNTCANVGTASTGTFTLVCTDITWSFTGADTFRYVILYNYTATSGTGARPLIAYWDYTSSITTANGDTFKADFGSNTFTLT